MSSDPFLNTSTKNILEHVFIPEIVETPNGYSVDMKLQNISTIGSSQLRVQDVWVDTLHFLQTDPVISGGGSGSSGIQGPIGPTGPQGIQGPVGPAGPPGSGSTGAALQITGPKGQVLFYDVKGLTSTSNFSVSNNVLTVPPIQTEIQLVNNSVLNLSTNQNSYIESGNSNVSGSGNSLLITDVGRNNVAVSVDTTNSRLGVNTANPQYELDVAGQTQLTFNGSQASSGITTIINTNVAGSVILSSGTYNIYAWGQGGYGQGGGAGGYLNGSLNLSSQSVVSWNDISGAMGIYAGGAALDILLNGVTLAVVPGGGGQGYSGSQGGWYGSSGGSPSPQSGQSATTSAGNGGFEYTGPNLATFNATTSLPVTSLSGNVSFPVGTSILVPTGTVITSPTGTAIIDNLNASGTVLFNPGGSGNINGLNVTGNNPLIFNNCNILLNSPSITAVALPFTTSNLSLSPCSANSGPTITVENGNQTIFSSVSLSVSGGSVTTGTYAVSPSALWKFLGGRGQTMTITITTPSEFSNISVDTLTNTATFIADTTITIDVPVATLSTSTIYTTNVSILVPSGNSFQSSNVLEDGNAGSGVNGGSGIQGGGGGAGFFGGGGGFLGGAGGAGSAYIASGYTLTVSGGYQSQVPLTHENTGYFGWGGLNPALPQIIIKEIIPLSTPNPALIVNGNISLGGAISIGGATLGNNNLTCPAGTTQTLGNVLCNSVTATGDISASGTQSHISGGSIGVPFGSNLQALFAFNGIYGTSINVPPSFPVGLVASAQVPGGVGSYALIANGPALLGSAGATYQSGLSVYGDVIVDTSAGGGGDMIVTGNQTIQKQLTTQSLFALNGIYGNSVSVPPSFPAGLTSTGTITGNDVVATSDRRVKSNIVTIDSALDKVLKMRGVYFTRNDLPERRTGVIAQEVEEVLPEVIYEDDNGIKAVSYGSIVGILIEAIKEQQELIKKLKDHLL